MRGGVVEERVSFMFEGNQSNKGYISQGLVGVVLSNPTATRKQRPEGTIPRASSFVA